MDLEARREANRLWKAAERSREARGVISLQVEVSLRLLERLMDIGWLAETDDRAAQAVAVSRLLAVVGAAPERG